MSYLESIRKALHSGRLGEFLFSPEKSEQRVRILLAVGLGAIAILFISDFFGGDATKTSTEPATYLAAGEDQDEYTARLESRLTELISSIDGAGRTKVMVTLECGREYVYASQQKTTSALSEDSAPDGRVSRDEKRSGEESLILIDGGRGEEPLILKEITPTVAGVVVLCSGADDIHVRQQIVNVVTTALGTSSNRVCVTRMK
ncbi:MAG: hypothetical protein IJM51_11870 [Clostridia bacterium]|nr:hypothetical protein [Clostridia bacterium]